MTKKDRVATAQNGDPGQFGSVKPSPLISAELIVAAGKVVSSMRGEASMLMNISETQVRAEIALSGSKIVNEVLYGKATENPDGWKVSLTSADGDLVAKGTFKNGAFEGDYDYAPADDHGRWKLKKTEQSGICSATAACYLCAGCAFVTAAQEVWVAICFRPLPGHWRPESPPGWNWIPCKPAKFLSKVIRGFLTRLRKRIWMRYLANREFTAGTSSEILLSGGYSPSPQRAEKNCPTRAR